MPQVSVGLAGPMPPHARPLPGSCWPSLTLSWALWEGGQGGGHTLQHSLGGTRQERAEVKGQR